MTCPTYVLFLGEFGSHQCYTNKIDRMFLSSNLLLDILTPFIEIAEDILVTF